MMDPAIKAEWVKRLRSGDYEQGKRHLNANGRYCCLGVLCEIAVEAGIVTKFESGNEIAVITSNNETAVIYDRKFSGILPPRVVEWSGLESSDPILLRESSEYWTNGMSLSHVNDMLEFDFKQIADLIEREA